MVSELIFERLIMDLSLTPPCRRTCALAVVNNNELSWVLEPPYSLKAAYDRLKSVPTLISGHTADPGKVRSGVSSSTIPRKGLGKWIGMYIHLHTLLFLRFSSVNVSSIKHAFLFAPSDQRPGTIAHLIPYIEPHLLVIYMPRHTFIT